ncbi:MAG: type IV-A pilus assembly ATPase PilB, partial [Gammaproteobacteria bacterium]|nr:type IV-A pilus assembly ATPase PilB [Gammaproteobacteria bacterium]
MVTTKPSIKLSGLAHRLVRDDLLTEEQAQQAFNAALKKRTPFVTYLVENELLQSLDIAQAASQEFGVPLFDLDVLDMEQLPIKLVDEKLIR